MGGLVAWEGYSRAEEKGKGAKGIVQSVTLLDARNPLAETRRLHGYNIETLIRLSHPIVVSTISSMSFYFIHTADIYV